MIRFELDPPRSAGGIEIGQPLAEAESLLRSFEGFVPPAPGEYQARGVGNYANGMTISIGTDAAGLVNSVEIFRPSGGVQVVYEGVSVFEESADVLSRTLSRHSRVLIEEHGHRIWAPELLLAFWRSVLPDGPDDEDGRYFDAVLLAAPGYYDS